MNDDEYGDVTLAMTEDGVLTVTAAAEFTMIADAMLEVADPRYICRVADTITILDYLHYWIIGEVDGYYEAELIEVTPC